MLRSVRKHFAILQAVNPATQRVTLLLDGETLPKVWDLTPDAEIKRAGWWARLDQLTLGDRVWVWSPDQSSERADRRPDAGGRTE